MSWGGYDTATGLLTLQGGSGGEIGQVVLPDACRPGRVQALCAVGRFVSESSFGPTFEPNFRPVIQGTDKQHLTVDVAWLSRKSLAKQCVAKCGRLPGQQCDLESGCSAPPAGTASHPVRLCGHAAFFLAPGFLLGNSCTLGCLSLCLVCGHLRLYW